MVFVLYLAGLVLLALLTAYTRNYQRTVVDLDQALDGGGRLLPPGQSLRTTLVVLGWPAAVIIGLLFVAWWKAMALAVGAFLLLTPVLGSFTPRAMSPHFLRRVRAHLEGEAAEGRADRAELRRLAERIGTMINETRSP